MSKIEGKRKSRQYIFNDWNIQMALWLTELNAVAKDLDSVPRIHT